MNIRITDGWELRPRDGNNWELYQVRVTADTHKSRKSGNSGKVQWLPCGRFYQYGGLDNAIRYVADEVMKDNPEESMSLREFAAEHERMLTEWGENLIAQVREVISGAKA